MQKRINEYFANLLKYGRGNVYHTKAISIRNKKDLTQKKITKIAFLNCIERPI